VKVGEKSWTEVEAQMRFPELLAAAKDSGPQYVTSGSGRFVVRYEADLARPPAGKFLSSGLPDD